MQQLWGYKVEKKLHLEVREQKRLNTCGLEYAYLYFGPRRQEDTGRYVMGGMHTHRDSLHFSGLFIGRGFWNMREK
jgi:hypothetical protein